MKLKFLFLAIVMTACVFSSCSKDDDNNDVGNGDNQWTAESVLKLLSTTWIFDQPSESRWEKTQFKETGVFYSSYYDLALYSIQENINGRYTLDSKGNILGQWRLDTGELLNLDWTIISISGLNLSIKNNEAGLEFTYSKLLSEIDIKSEESVTPDYEGLIPQTITKYKSIDKGVMANPKLKGFASHNSRIAEVDEYTGEIKAHAGGRTYIDVITTEGTAVIEVNVTGVLPYDYCDFLGADRNEIYAEFGNSPILDNDKQIVYLLSEGDYEYLFFNFDNWTGKVKAVAVVAKDGCSFTDDEMRKYLSYAYHAYEKGTTDTKYAYINAETYDEATAGIIWYPNDRQLVFVAIDHDIFKDYSPLLGKTKEEVLTLMEVTPFKNTDEYIAYGLNEKYLSMVSAFYTIDYVSYSPTALVVIASVQQDANKTEIINFFNKKYIYIEKESNDNNRIYLTADGKLVVEYDLLNNQIWYYKNGPILSTKSVKAMKAKGLNLQ